MLPDSVLDGTPEEHYINILKSADPDVVRKIVFEYFNRLAACELLIEEKGLEEELKCYPYDKTKEVEERSRDYVIESMANIVASHER
ncbi:MAG: DUF2018 family protein [Campylobacterales bacterium]|nr:DUF2018 family protein [Campylobacterales bacterium]